MPDRPVADPAPALVAPLQRPARPPRREWWRGPPPTGLTRRILAELVVPRRSDRTSPPRPPFHYFADEVDQAQQYTARWAGCLLNGMDETEILTWIRALDTGPAEIWPPSRHLDADDAIALNAAGITPYDLRWHYGDELHGTLVERLRRSQMTIDEVVLEAQHRREQD